MSDIYLSELLSKTQQQDRLIETLMESIKRLQTRCAELEQARLTTNKFTNCDIESREEIKILGTYATQNGVIVESEGCFIPYTCTQCAEAWCMQSCTADAISKTSHRARK